MALPQVAHAERLGGARVVSTTSWVEQWDPVSESWVRVEDDQASAPVTTVATHIVNGIVVAETTEAATTDHRAARFAVPIQAAPRTKALAQYGPFRVLDARRVALVGSTGIDSPHDFDAMMRDFPQLAILEMIDAPGTRHDIANLALGRRIRAAGLATHVPDGGSVRSGAVELFLAGAKRSMGPGAIFAVHSWRDSYGREAGDIAADAPEHRLYLDYYAEMGMSEARAREFYAMTNSVAHNAALWLNAADMQPWIALEAPALSPVSFADSGAALEVLVLAPEPVRLVAIESEAPRIAYAGMIGDAL